MFLNIAYRLFKQYNPSTTLINLWISLLTHNKHVPTLVFILFYRLKKTTKTNKNDWLENKTKFILRKSQNSTKRPQTFS